MVPDKNLEIVVSRKIHFESRCIFLDSNEPFLSFSRDKSSSAGSIILYNISFFKNLDVLLFVT